MISPNSKIAITGANGLVGTALCEELRQQGYTNLALLTRDLCDLTDFQKVKSVFATCQPDVVFHTAATVYGIGGNAAYKGSIFTENIWVNTHVIEASRLCGVKKIVAMGTIAAYPEPKTYPVKEGSIWDGPPHQSEASYGHAKRAMLAQLTAYREAYGLDFAYVISTNLFGPNDKFNPIYGHVIPSLVCKCYEAKMNGSPVIVWGDGTAERDFLYSKDMARALVLIMNQFTGAINVASGQKTSIKEAVRLLAEYYQIEHRIQWDPAKPNGRKYYEIDLNLLKSMGFAPAYSFQEGLIETLDWYTLRAEENLVRI